MDPLVIQSGILILILGTFLFLSSKFFEKICLLIHELFPRTIKEIHQIKINDRLHNIEESFQTRLEAFKNESSSNQYKVLIQHPDIKGCTPGGSEIPAEDLIEIVLYSGEHINQLKSTMVIDLNDDRFIDDMDCEKLCVSWLDDFISSHNYTYKRQRHTHF